MVDAENHARAEKRAVRERERRVVVVCLIPQALARNAHALSCNLADNGLNYDFVCGDGQLLGLGLNLAHDILNPILGLCVVVLLVGHVGCDDILDDLLNLWWEEPTIRVLFKGVRYSPVLFFGLEPVGALSLAIEVHFT